jgi:hypothetical protein
MHQGGVNVVVISAGGVSLDALQTYAAAAQSLGMSIMWETSNPGWWQEPSDSTYMSGFYPAFAAACGCDQDAPLLAYTIHWLSSLPATYGYYAADDSTLAPGDGTAIGNYVAEIKQQDPSQPVMIGSADQSQTDAYEGSADMIGVDIYPVTTSSLMPASTNQDMWASVAQTALDTQRSADQAGKQSAFILQAFTWGDNLADGQTIGVCSPTDTQASCYAKLVYPTGADQLQLRNEILEHAHPKLILWWSFQGTYGQAGNDTYSIYPTGAVAGSQWSGLAAAIQAPPPSTGTTPNQAPPPPIGTTPKTASGGPVAHAAGLHQSNVHPSTRGKRTRHRRRSHHRRRRHHRLGSFVAHAAAAR